MGTVARLMCRWATVSSSTRARTPLASIMSFTFRCPNTYSPVITDWLTELWFYVTHTPVYTHPFNGPFSRTTRVSRYQKGKTNLDFTEAKRQWVAVASAGPYASLHLAPDRWPRQHPTTQFFTGRMLFLPPNQQRQNTEGIFDTK